MTKPNGHLHHLIPLSSLAQKKKQNSTLIEFLFIIRTIGDAQAQGG